MDFLMDNMGTILIVAVVAAIALNLIGFLAPLFGGRSRVFVEKATDIHEAVYRKRKKAARLNMSGIRSRRVSMSGDAYHSPTNLGRLYGVIPADPVCDVFVRRRRWGKVRWYMVPTALISGWLSKELHIDGGGTVAIGNFFIPVWPATSKPWEYDDLILKHEEFIMAQEKNVELEELRGHSIQDSTQMSTKDRRIIERNETPQQYSAPPEHHGEASDD
jgi:hypothetical protein